MPSRRFPAKRGILLKRIHKMRHAVAITDRKPAPKMGSIPTLATLMATAFRPHNRQRAVNSEADFASSFSFAEKAFMEELSLTPNQKFRTKPRVFYANFEEHPYMGTKLFA